MMTKDKEKEDVVPQDNVEATQEEAPEAYNPYAGWMQSVGDIYKAKQEKVAQEQARYDALLQKMRDAKENKQSVVKALMQEQKPVYDYDAEKREKNKAAIKALGDVFSAITAGAHAYGKNGAGVVPTLAENSPLKEIEKINAMQEQYRKQNEAWKALDINWRAQEEEAKVKAAEAMATAAGKDLETAIKDADAARDAISKGLLDIGNAEYKNANANARWAASEEGRERRHKETLAARKADSDSGKAKEDHYDKVLAAYDELFGVKNYGPTTTSTRKIGSREFTTTNEKTFPYHMLTKDAKASYAKTYKDMPIMILYEHDPEKAMEFAQQANKDIGEANKLAEAYINGL